MSFRTERWQGSECGDAHPIPGRGPGSNRRPVRGVLRRLPPAPARGRGGRRQRAGGGGGIGPFVRGQEGATAAEVAISAFVLMLALAGLTGIVRDVYEADRLDRGARAAARAVALLGEAPATAAALEAVACGAIRNELGFEAAFDCAASWTLAIDAFETPAALLAGTPRAGDDAVIGGEDGDMVRVRIAALVEDAGEEDADEDEDADADADADDGASEPLDVLAEAVARNDRAG